jgi:hypothetical protein
MVKKQTADQAYQAERNEALRAIEGLKMRLETHAANQARHKDSQADWGYAGDLAHLNGILSELLPD